jgi:hypothetical protein
MSLKYIGKQPQDTIHHTAAPSRAIEHAQSRDTMAHKLITPTAPDGLRSTRGFAAVKGSQPAVDIQPRHGGKAKGGVVKHSWGNTDAQIAKENLTHIVTEAVSGAPDGSSANPLDLMTSSQAGKRQPPTMVHDGMTRQQIADANFNGEDILREAAELPATVTEKDCK